MIRVETAPEPLTFDREVRQKGLSAISELIGQGQTIARRGPPRTGPRYQRPEEIPSKALPTYWRAALDDLLTSYRRICAYTSLYIEPVTGAPSVDHMVPKSKQWDRIYEWTNYRLACAEVNSWKGSFEDVLDPFEIGDWFELEWVGFQVRVRANLSAEVAACVGLTISRLRLNDSLCVQQRSDYVAMYDSGLGLGWLERRAPFVAQELRRAGRLRPTDG